MSAAIQLDLWETAAAESGGPITATLPPVAAPQHKPSHLQSARERRRREHELRRREIAPQQPSAEEAAHGQTTVLQQSQSDRDDSKPALLQQLRQKLRRMESADPPAGSAISTGSAALDELLPAGGLAAGTINEWLGDPASGAGWLALIAARSALRQRGGHLVVLDSAADIYPPALISAGIPAGRLVVLRPRTRSDLVWAIDQTLRCPAVAAVWGSIDKIDDRQQRRLQLAAETGGGLGLFVRPPRSLSQPSWATVRLHVQPHWGHGQRRMQVRLVRTPGAHRGAAVLLEIDGARGGQLRRCDVPAAARPHVGSTSSPFDQEPRDGTSALHLAAELAHPAAARKRTRRTA